MGWGANLPGPAEAPQLYEGVRLRRLFAFAVDCLVIGVLMGGVALVGVVIGLLTFGLGLAFIVPAFAVIGILYRTTMVMEQGATLGMMLMGVELRTAAGERATGLQSFTHAAAFTAMSYLPPVLICSLLWSLMNPKGLLLHDAFAGMAMINRPA